MYGGSAACIVQGHSAVQCSAVPCCDVGCGASSCGNGCVRAASATSAAFSPRSPAITRDPQVVLVVVGRSLKCQRYIRPGIRNLSSALPGTMLPSSSWGRNIHRERSTTSSPAAQWHRRGTGEWLPLLHMIYQNTPKPCVCVASSSMPDYTITTQGCALV